MTNTALMKGFLVGDYASRYNEALHELAEWLRDGNIQYAEHIVDGFEKTIEAFLGSSPGESRETAGEGKRGAELAFDIDNKRVSDSRASKASSYGSFASGRVIAFRLA